MTDFLLSGEHDISADRYHTDPCPAPSLSAGIADRLLQATPLHAWTASPRLNPDFEPEEKTTFDIGSAAHELLTGKGRGIWVVDAEDYRTKAAQAERDGARADGYTPLTKPQSKQVNEMIRLARLQLNAHGIGDPFARGDNERTLIWERDGVWNRCMVDCLDRENRVAYDYKTAAGLADPEAWIRAGVRHSVDMRAAHYLEGLEATTGAQWKYRFIVQEKAAPHCLSVLELSSGAIGMGKKRIAMARAYWRDCLRSNRWPGYSAEIAVVEPPIWYEAQFLERETREADMRREGPGRDVLARSLDFAAIGTPLERKTA